MIETVPAEGFTTRYAGVEWLEKNIRYWPKMKGKEISSLGRRSADLLGYVFRGIYHISAAAQKVDWSDQFNIKVVVLGGIATFDNSVLTRLVIAAHDACLRVEIEGVSSWGYLRLWISHRHGRAGEFWQVHPTIEDAIERERNDH